MALLWWRQLRTGDATVVDVAWSALLGGAALYYCWRSDGAPAQRWLVVGVGGLWSARLTWHLAADRLGGEEDGRYRALRRHWGAGAPLHFAWFFQLQAAAAAVLSVPFLLAAANPHPLSAVQGAGVGLVVLGVAGESVADAQLARFRRDPASRGRACRSGLWRYSRHPNYFFEWVVWCGFAVLALPAPYGVVALLAPVVMYVLVRWVSGIPHTEAQALRSRGDDYRAYQAETNAFFPGPARGGPTAEAAS